MNFNQLIKCPDCNKDMKLFKVRDIIGEYTTLKCECGAIYTRTGMDKISKMFGKILHDLPERIVFT